MTTEGVESVMGNNDIVELQFFTKDNSIYILSDHGELVEVTQVWGGNEKQF